jgi:putative DNA primase/helicase
VIAVVQEIMGYLMVPVTKAQKAFIFYGPGRTGKSTLIALIESLIGESNTCHVPLQKLEDRFDKASLFGKLLNTCADLPAKPLTDTAAFKILTGEDILHAERKFKEPFSFKNKARLLFSCNQLPVNAVDHTDGFYRRLLIVPFFHQVPEEKINTNLLDELKEELDGIAQWGLKGLERLASNNYVFTPNHVSQKLLDLFKLKNNTTQWFVKNFCIISAEAKTYSKDLYEYYVQVCKMNGMQPRPINIFVTELLQFYGTSIQRKHEPKTRRSIFQGICFNKKIV